MPYKFCSDDLAKLIEVTPSVRTKLTIISNIAPRLSDPHARLSYFTGLFRYSEEKAVVEEVLRDRAQTLSASIFTRIEATALSPKTAAGRGLYGGRGGRGGGRLGPYSPRQNMSSSPTTPAYQNCKFSDEKLESIDSRASMLGSLSESFRIEQCDDDFDSDSDEK